MPSALIIGSGPGAAGAALALTADPRQQVTVIDIGTTLEPELQDARHALALSGEADWSPSDRELISRQPVVQRKGALPEKRAYGSDFPFRNVGQLDGLEAVGAANRSVVSGAYGGFSNVWGAQVMPFSRRTFDQWPVTLDTMENHYKAALTEMNLAGDEDDLSEHFPLLVQATPLPPLSDRTTQVLRRYGANRAQVRSHGITVGRARLAFRAGECTLCGMCMTGCPQQLIYSSSQTFDRLRSEGRITYRSNVLATRLSEQDDGPSVMVRDLTTGKTERLSADRIFVACGAMGTTRLVLGSLHHFDRPVTLQESVQFVMPCGSLRPSSDPRSERDFTLNQFNLLFDASGDGLDLCQIHFYGYNPAFLGSLPKPLLDPKADRALTAVLRRVFVGLGYVPGWAAPRVRVIARSSSSSTDELPDMTVERDGGDRWPPMLRQLAGAMLAVAPTLDLWPALPMTSLSPAAKSYHFGGSFPHADNRTEQSTDVLGRLAHWDNIHLVDASVFPNVPATTFTLTIMANAHRIANEVLRELA